MKTAVNCGDVATIVCNATNTNRVTIYANSSDVFGTHTYERASARVARAGTLDLYLVKAVPTENQFLTNFTVAASEIHLGKTTTMVCEDTYESKAVAIETMGELYISSLPSCY